jgi:hypothetical protein
MNDTGEFALAGRLAPGDETGPLDALCAELGPEMAVVVDAAGRVLGVVRWGLRGVEVVEG